MESVTLNVQGMSCGHCVKAVEGSVGEMKGVKTVAVDLQNGKVKVDFDSASVSLDEIKETIDDQGYEVK
ncbi:copper chaperone [Cytobacillus horneckiae]|uniref:Copper chaperone CopZ n=1 Tax=Cytobacillus horneckiae TaxID=549687 RepID=A0A2N0ZLA9_9BACI|nr:copper chaperone CopZ [Cytobacillus horneckiae]MBN6885735.1 copper chaperone CopZ [Cytobacillus horneckiae]MCM3177282.1 copper chaperone CopZ [Cytobacillus horneckiae]MEC1156156.1 copper chaperone CopZ [Cytobacillus horneckiae]MED2937515.1 copper chaperone CopZ [Cytobacillus horneckiae]PKG30304.1 copper resistance protein CopZ [Cytobacillus horneckiae]